MTGKRNTLAAAAVAVLVIVMAGCAGAPGPKFEISFPASARGQATTGRVFVVISTKDKPEPILQAGSWTDRSPVFAADVTQLRPGQAAVIDRSTSGYPLASLADIPAGDYYVQALLNVYTECHRSDGHTLWVHLDQWEGQHFNRSPGNLTSNVQRIHLDARAGYDVKLSLDKVIPPVKMPADTEWVKHVKIQSAMLTRFWGQPIYLGATVLLPKDYDQHPGVYYPVLYEQGHFSLLPPLGFTTVPPDPEVLKRAGEFGIYLERGYDLYQHWLTADFPRMIVVTFQHPTPFFDDSYAVNSVNNGPYGDAILQELIPYLETHYRILRKPYARVLSGGSTGGWESLALEVLHPDFFGGTWTFYPDPIDFRRYQMVDIYDDPNAFTVPGFEWQIPERPLQRTPEGQMLVTERDESRLESVLGSHGRSGQQLEIWEAAYGPIGDDGYPKPLWDKQTGAIDHSVALYMRDHGYDLSYYLKTHWDQVGKQLAGKIHVYVGDMDSFYLNLAVYDLEDVLKGVKNPSANAEFQYGRPMKGHGWQPMSHADLLRMMADFITKHAPPGERTAAWKYR
ncbi:MAG TPA: alpha/beta hydrolase-fold protein [Candidatus Acidoferrales bacterium]|nr:alpha/beta hydrolase-fold protein [Candidatus Acidoferrales bacterium]